MPLTVTFDPVIPRLAEPGYSQYFPTRLIADQAVPATSSAQKALLAEPATGTLMLRPLQLRDDWLNTAEQLSSIIRLADFNVSSVDLADGRVFEANLFGNVNNPWIHHAPVSPTALTPFTGIASPISLTPIEDLSDGSFSVTGAIPGGPGAAADGRFIGETTQRLIENQALFLRWFNPENNVGHQATYVFGIGQYFLVIREAILEVMRDTSAAGDRSSWKKVTSVPIWTPGSYRPASDGSIFGRILPADMGPHYRTLLWLPFRRTQVLVLTNFGAPLIFQARPAASPKRIKDQEDADVWEITRSDTFIVWALTPSPGHFQVQRVAYPVGPATLNLPHVILHYTPVSLPTHTANTDEDKGTSIASGITEPPGYTTPVNDADDCPEPTTGASGQSRTYGVTATFNGEASGRWTPFLYGIHFHVDPKFVNPGTAATGFADTEAAAARIRHATVSIGMDPGDGTCSFEMFDETPLPAIAGQLPSYYYRTSLPLQLHLSGTACFTGLSEPHEISTIKSGGERFFRVRALDRWKQLVDTRLRDQRDWTGVGHVQVIRFIAQQGGIDTTNADTFAIGSAQDTPLGGLVVTTPQQTRDVKPHWQPKIDDTAASFIKRIADEYADFMVGFHADGTFFYRPRDYYTTSVLTFFRSRAEAVANGQPTAPIAQWEPMPEERPVEPAANYVQIFAAYPGGKIRGSAAFVDFASIQNPDVVNYIGRMKQEIRATDTVLTCSELNKLTHVAFQRLRRRKRLIRWRGDYVPTLKLGQVVTLFGVGDFRLQGWTAQLMKDTAAFALYEGERLERGYGLP